MLDHGWESISKSFNQSDSTSFREQRTTTNEPISRYRRSITKRLRIEAGLRQRRLWHRIQSLSKVFRRKRRTKDAAPRCGPKGSSNKTKHHTEVISGVDEWGGNHEAHLASKYNTTLWLIHRHTSWLCPDKKAGKSKHSKRRWHVLWRYQWD